MSIKIINIKKIIIIETIQLYSSGFEILYEIAGGEAAYRERPFVSNSNCFVVPPMKFATESCEVMEECRLSLLGGKVRGIWRCWPTCVCWTGFQPVPLCGREGRGALCGGRWME